MYIVIGYESCKSLCIGDEVEEKKDARVAKKAKLDRRVARYRKKVHSEQDRLEAFEVQEEVTTRVKPRQK